MAILRTTKKAIVRVICETISVEKRSSQELMDSLSLKKTLDRPARVGRV